MFDDNGSFAATSVMPTNHDGESQKQAGQTHFET
jgi:hypothetical protein